MIDKRAAKKLWDDTYADSARTPESWFVHCLKLVKAGDLIWDESERYVQTIQKAEAGDLLPIPVSNKISMMLYGLAVENALKAVAISQIGSALDANGKFKLNSHCLVDLAKDAKLVIGPEDATLLEKLEQFIEWAGRYPIPLNRDDMRPRLTPDGNSAYLTSVSAEDRIRTHRLIARIQTQLGIEVHFA